MQLWHEIEPEKVYPIGDRYCIKSGGLEGNVSIDAHGWQALYVATSRDADEHNLKVVIDSDTAQVIHRDIVGYTYNPTPDELNPKNKAKAIAYFNYLASINFQDGVGI